MRGEIHSDRELPRLKVSDEKTQNITEAEQNRMWEWREARDTVAEVGGNRSPGAFRAKARDILKSDGKH